MGIIARCFDRRFATGIGQRIHNSDVACTITTTTISAHRKIQRVLASALVGDVHRHAAVTTTTANALRKNTHGAQRTGSNIAIVFDVDITRRATNSPFATNSKIED